MGGARAGLRRVGARVHPPRHHPLMVARPDLELSCIRWCMTLVRLSPTSATTPIQPALPVQASRLRGRGATLRRLMPPPWCRCHPTLPATAVACSCGLLGTAAAGCRQHGQRGRASLGCSPQTCRQLACGSWRSWWRRTSGRGTSRWCRVRAGCTLLPEGPFQGVGRQAALQRRAGQCGLWVGRLNAPLPAGRACPPSLPPLPGSPPHSSLGQQLGVFGAAGAALVCPRAH